MTRIESIESEQPSHYTKSNIKALIKAIDIKAKSEINPSKNRASSDDDVSDIYPKSKKDY